MSNYLQEQKRLIEERKRQVLERAALKKTEGNAREPPAMSTAPNGPNNATGTNLLANDGNFLARFQAMQKQAQVKKEEESKESSSGKVKISLGGVKKKEFKPVTSTFPRPTAFENPEPSSNSEEGKLMLMSTSPLGQGFCFETHVIHDLIVKRCCVVPFLTAMLKQCSL